MCILFLLLCSCSKEDALTPSAPSTPPAPPVKIWSNLASMPTARHDFGFVECNNLLYAVGGYNADGLNKVEAYDPASDKWTTKKAMPTARGYLVVASVANKIYAIGGITGGDLNNITYINATEEYDPVSDTWTKKSPIPIEAVAFNSVLGNLFMTGTAINGKIYVVVGYTEGEVPTYIYDPATDKWTTGKSISKFNLSPYYSTASENDLYVTNGDHFLKYSPSDDDWRELPLPLTSVLGSVYNSCLTSYNNNIYCIGGLLYNAGASINSGDAEHYDAVNSIWTEDSSLNTERNAAAAVVYKDKLYVAGGAVIQPNYTNVPIPNLEAIQLK